MNYDEIMEFLVEEVKKRIEEKENRNKNKEEKNSALVIIHGGNIDLLQVLVELEKLSKNYNLEVAYTENGRKLSYGKISKVLENEIKITYENVDKILEEKKMILLPFLTKSSAAKIAYGIRDTEIGYLISKAILSEKIIVATNNSCRINGNSEYINQINSNIDKLKKYGIRFAEAKDFSTYVDSIFTNKVVYLMQKTSISTKDIANLYDVDVVISKDTKITNLVYDKAKDSKIRFIRE